MSLWRNVLIASVGSAPAPTPTTYTQWELTVPAGGGEYSAFLLGSVDWGDGTSATISDQNNRTSHTYAEGVYVITLSGANHRVRHQNEGGPGVNRSWVSRILALGTDLNPNFGRAFQNCPGLTAILCAFPEHITSMNYAFANDVSLVAVPYPTLPVGIATQPSTGAGLALTFGSCPFPADIAVILANITPSTKSRFDYTFYLCPNIYGVAPAEKLWQNANITNHAHCFNGCIGLSNYDDIPSDWK